MKVSIPRAWQQPALNCSDIQNVSLSLTFAKRTIARQLNILCCFSFRLCSLLVFIVKTGLTRGFKAFLSVQLHVDLYFQQLTRSDSPAGGTLNESHVKKHADVQKYLHQVLYSLRPHVSRYKRNCSQDIITMVESPWSSFTTFTEPCFPPVILSHLSHRNESFMKKEFFFESSFWGCLAFVLHCPVSLLICSWHCFIVLVMAVEWERCEPSRWLEELSIPEWIFFISEKEKFERKYL